jgi:hypothetical protein
MSQEQYEEDCQGCRPVCVDVETGQVMGPDTLIMQILNKIWDTIPKAEREAYHRVMCNASRAESDLATVQGIIEKFQGALKQRELN